LFIVTPATLEDYLLQQFSLI